MGLWHRRKKKKQKDQERSLYYSAVKAIENTEPLLDVPVCADSTFMSVQAGEKDTTIPSFLLENKPYFHGSGELELGVRYISDLHLTHHILKHFNQASPPTNDEIKKYVSSIIVELLPKYFSGDKNYILIGGDVSSSFALSKLFYRELHRQIKARSLNAMTKVQIYCILGNHELWEFDSLQTCVQAYRQMLEPLGFHLLQNEMTECSEFLIVGGEGFAGQNPLENADRGLYKKALSRKQEIEESSAWVKAYQDALSLSREKKVKIIVFTHNPITDWMGDAYQGDAGCIYFSGHTHNPYRFHDDDRDIHIYADNQVGYDNMHFVLKKAWIYKRINPFADFPEGASEVAPRDYLDFHSYAGEMILGIAKIEQYIQKYDLKLFMIKYSGYYGFFLLGKRRAYICSGGNVSAVYGGSDKIDYYLKRFPLMVQAFLTSLSPYRQAQEMISRVVKSFGGLGIIQGCIIDIDALNHIMLNPNDGRVTYYFSPVYGQVQSYASLPELLKHHLPELLPGYSVSSGNVLLENLESVPASEDMVEVDRARGMYGISRQMNQVQRLFSSKILRVWDESLLDKTLEKNHELLQG